MDPILIYLLIINAVSLVIMLVDKYNAMNNMYRIPERGLWTVCIFGGSMGCLLGMLLFRHKSQKRAFTVGFPLIALCHIVLLVLYLQ